MCARVSCLEYFPLSAPAFAKFRINCSPISSKLAARNNPRRSRGDSRIIPSVRLSLISAGTPRSLGYSHVPLAHPALQPWSSDIPIHNILRRGTRLSARARSAQDIIRNDKCKGIPGPKIDARLRARVRAVTFFPRRRRDETMRLGGCARGGEGGGRSQ